MRCLSILVVQNNGVLSDTEYQDNTCQCGQIRLHRLLLVSRPGCEPQLLAGDWRAAVEQWTIGTQVRTSLLRLCVGVCTQPMAQCTMLGYISVSPVSPGPCMTVDSDF